DGDRVAIAILNGQQQPNFTEVIYRSVFERDVPAYDSGIRCHPRFAKGGGRLGMLKDAVVTCAARYSDETDLPAIRKEQVHFAATHIAQQRQFIGVRRADAEGSWRGILRSIPPRQRNR